MPFEIARFECQRQDPGQPFEFAAAVFVENTDPFAPGAWKETSVMPPERLAEIDLNFDSIAAIVNAAVVAESAAMRERAETAEASLLETSEQLLAEQGRRESAEAELEVEQRGRAQDAEAAAAALTEKTARAAELEASLAIERDRCATIEAELASEKEVREKDGEAAAAVLETKTSRIAELEGALSKKTEPEPVPASSAAE